MIKKVLDRLGVQDTPTDEASDTAISSEWAYEHENDADAHHNEAHAPAAHKDTHDPVDGSDKLDSAAPVKIGSANAIGSSHSFPRADHVHEREHAKYTNAEVQALIDATIFLDAHGREVFPA